MRNCKRLIKRNNITNEKARFNKEEKITNRLIYWTFKYFNPSSLLYITHYIFINTRLIIIISIIIIL